MDYVKPNFEVVTIDQNQAQPRGLFMVAAASAVVVYLVGAVVHAGALWVASWNWTVK